jgi:hypothetical protein
MTRHSALSTNWYKNTGRFLAAAKSTLLLAVATLSLTLSCPRESAAGQITSARNEKLAEMAAMARHNENCPDIPRQWAAAYLTLLVTTPPTEEQVVIEERKTLALRREIGIVRWCQLYSVEMEQAFLIYQYIIRR